MATKSNYALRMPASLKAEAERLAAADGTTLNQLINVAVAEKISALNTAAYITGRGARADVPRALELLAKSGRHDTPVAGDELE